MVREMTLPPWSNEWHVLKTERTKNEKLRYRSNCLVKESSLRNSQVLA